MERAVGTRRSGAITHSEACKDPGSRRRKDASLAGNSARSPLKNRHPESARPQAKRYAGTSVRTVRRTQYSVRLARIIALDHSAAFSVDAGFGSRSMASKVSRFFMAAS